MISPLRTPLLSAAYALIGVGVATLWIRFGLWWVVLLLTVLAAAAAAIAERTADASVVTKPMRALRLYEAQSAIVGVVSAFAGGLVVVITLWAATIAGTADPEKTLITTASAAVTALVSGIFVTVKETDETLGSHVRDEFRERFKTDTRIPRRSPTEKAIYSDVEADWSDWSRAIRKKRVQNVQTFLDSLGTAPQHKNPMRTK